MRTKSIITVLLLIVVGASCQKTSSKLPPEAQDPDSTIFLPPAYQLKNLNVERLPSPYYSFTYDNSRRATKIDHSSGLLQYDCYYKGLALEKIVKNNPGIPADTLKYEYTNKLVTKVRVVGQQTGLKEEVSLSYDTGELKKIEWVRFTPQGTEMYRRLLFTFSGSNISKMEDFRDNGSGMTLSATTTYSDYDSKTNPEANFIIKNNVNEHFIYLPYLRLQVNNPGKEVINNGTNVITSMLTYNYNGNLPTSRSRNVTITSPGNAPFSFNATDTYSYY